MAVQISGNDITVPRDGSFTRNVTIGGTLTYEDVTNIDSVGLVTARNGIEIGAGPGVAASISVDGNMIVSGISTFGGAANFAAISGTTGTFTGDVDIADSIVHTGDNSKIRFPSNDVISFETSGSEGARLDAGRRFLIGSTTARTSGGGAYAHLQVEGTDSPGAEILVIRNSNDTYASTLGLVKTRGTSDGAVTTVADNDKLGQIQFRGADGSDIYSVAASIHGEVDGSPSDGTDMPGALVFGTTADAAASPTERLRITSDGNIGIGENSPANLLHVKVSDTGVSPHGSAQIVLERSGTNYLQFLTAADGTSGLLFGDANDNDVAQIKYDHNVPAMQFITETAERMSIDSSGNVDVKTGNLVIGTAGKGIDFSANSDASGMSSELLDDYEEGTFTPIFYYASGTSGVSYSVQEGRYTKVGRLVSFQLRLALTNKGSGSNNARIGGLPFTPAAAGVNYDMFMISVIVGCNLGSARDPFAQMEDYSVGRITLYSFDYSSASDYAEINSGHLDNDFTCSLQGNYVTAS